jgi:hypothetical protein
MSLVAKTKTTLSQPLSFGNAPTPRVLSANPKPLNMKPGLADNKGVVTLAAQLLRVKYSGVLRTCEHGSDNR